MVAAQRQDSAQTRPNSSVIPEAWHSIWRRLSPFYFAGNRNVAHSSVNVISNYSYTVLESEVRIKTNLQGTLPLSASSTKAGTAR